MSINIIKEILESYTIDITVSIDGENITIPNKIFEGEVEARLEGKESLIDTYISDYRKVKELIREAKYFIRGEDIEVSGDELFIKLSGLKTISNIDLILQALSLENDEIEILKKRVIECYYDPSKIIRDIESEYFIKTELTQEYLDNLLRRIKNERWFTLSELDNIKNNGWTVVIHGEQLFSCYDMSECYKVYLTELPIKGLINKYKINDGYIKYIELNEDRTLEEIETIYAEMCYVFEPSKLHCKDISIKNSKWRTSNQIKEQYGINSMRQLRPILDNFAIAYKKINNTFLINRDEFEEGFKKYKSGAK